MLAGTHNKPLSIRKRYGSTEPGPLLYGSCTEVDQITEATHNLVHLSIVVCGHHNKHNTFACNFF